MSSQRTSSLSCPEDRINEQLLTNISISFLILLDLIPQYFEAWYEQVTDENVKKIADWFRDFYVGGGTRRRLFNPQMWSIAKLTKEGFSITQAPAESFHNANRIIVDEKHPCFYKVVSDHQFTIEQEESEL
jgi:hypothetical protein